MTVVHVDDKIQQAITEGSAIPVLDKGYVYLVDHMGSDKSVSDAARASFSKESNEFSDRDAKLIDFLAKAQHNSVFRHCFVTLEVKAPLEVARQWWKYVVGSDHTFDGWNEACFAAYQPVVSWDNEERFVATTNSAEDLYDLCLAEQEMPYAVSLEGGKFVKNQISSVWASGHQEVFRVVTADDHTIDVTEDHRFLTADGYKALKDFESGERVIVNNTASYNGLEVSTTSMGFPEESKVSLIYRTGEVATYDIEMSGVDNLVVGGFVVHNSRRYITSEPEFYVVAPDEWRGKPDNMKQGSKGYLPKDLGFELTSTLENYYEEGDRLYHWAIDDMGVAPEVARLFLPAYGMYVHWRWSASLQSVAHFLAQRLAHDAQHEITQYAQAVRELVEPLYPHSIGAFLES